MKYTKQNLRMAFASGIDFAVINKDIPLESAFRDKGFSDIIGQIKTIREKEKLLNNKTKEQKLTETGAEFYCPECGRSVYSCRC
jgi:hypothetical protein